MGENIFLLYTEKVWQIELSSCFLISTEKRTKIELGAPNWNISGFKANLQNDDKVSLTFVCKFTVAGSFVRCEDAE